ncbi:DNA-binding response regulator [Clostridia bacterium]|nr:DNA-binding response regulator [Clostridia bacterium]
MLRIILADDDSIFIQGILKHIPWESLGLEVAGVASDGQEALNLCKKHQPDILLTDLRMPCVHGLDAAVQLHEALPNCHFIFMSAFAQPSDYRSAIKLKALDFLEKPVDLQELIYVLNHAVAQVIEPQGIQADKLQPSRVIKDVMRQVESRYMEDLTVALLAQMFYFTPNYLSMLFRKETGYTISYYLMLCRVEAANALLRDPALSIQAVASAVGYQDARHFSKVYQKIMNMTPSEFRKR